MEIKSKKQGIIKDLYNGACSDLAEALGFSEVYVYEVLTGKRNNKVILEAAEVLKTSVKRDLEHIRFNYHRKSVDAKLQDKLSSKA